MIQSDTYSVKPISLNTPIYLCTRQVYLIIIYYLCCSSKVGDNFPLSLLLQLSQ